eukprot:897222-Alexandrium_andersonii.AAC.1
MPRCRWQSRALADCPALRSGCARPLQGIWIPSRRGSQASGAGPTFLRSVGMSQGMMAQYTEQNKYMPVFTGFAALSPTFPMNSCQGE